MSLLAQVMEAVRFTEAQNQLILAGNIDTDRLALMFKRPKRQIQRQRALLKQIKAMEAAQ
jgi:hypothetical protein